MFNFIALLGWSPVGEDELFSQSELIQMFDPERLSKSPAAFDAKNWSGSTTTICVKWTWIS